MTQQIVDATKSEGDCMVQKHCQRQVVATVDTSLKPQSGKVHTAALFKYGKSCAGNQEGNGCQIDQLRNDHADQHTVPNSGTSEKGAVHHYKKSTTSRKTNKITF